MPYMPITSAYPIAFQGYPLDRADHIRNDPDALAAQMHWKARVFVPGGMDGLIPEIDHNGGIIWKSLADIDEDDELIWLGLDDAGKPHFTALNMAGGDGQNSPRTIWQDLMRLRPEQLAIYGAARGLIIWHRTHGFCANCGGSTQLAKAGWARHCDDCGTEVFPQTSPVVIMLAQYAGKLLLGRQPHFPAGSFSALAGFLEPGESIEEAVSRELYEEAGVNATKVRYFASQPWPFPGSLMIGCVADVASDALTIDKNELEDARWFSHDDVMAALNGDDDAAFRAPPPFAIARNLLQFWLDNEQS